MIIVEQFDGLFFDFTLHSPVRSFYQLRSCSELEADAVVATYHYDPFGNQIDTGASNTVAQPYRFQGQECHALSGLVLYTFRAYDPVHGRWLNPDPIGEAGGINLYAYAYNNTANYADLWGLMLDCDHLAMAAPLSYEPGTHGGQWVELTPGVAPPIDVPGVGFAEGMFGGLRSSQTAAAGGAHKLRLAKAEISPNSFR